MRQLMKCLITLWLTLSVSMGSYGLSGNDMHDQCGSNVDDAQPICLSYIRGFDEMAVLRELVKDDLKYCKPDGYEYFQFRKIVTKYMDDHPEELHKPFGVLLWLSLLEAFPCEE